MPSIPDIRTFRDLRYGWLGPAGELLSCALFAHLSVLVNVPALSQAFATYQATVDDNNAALADFQDGLEEDEHMPWHLWDNMNSDAERRMTLTAYRAGWVRLGLFQRVGTSQLRGLPPAEMRRRLNEAPLMLEAESVAETLDARHGDLDDLAVVLEATLSTRVPYIVDVEE